MKKLIYIASLLCLSASCMAQQKLQEGKFSIDGKTLVVKRSPYAKNTEAFLIHFQSDQYNKPYPAPRNPEVIPVLGEDIHFDMDKLNGIVRNVVGEKRKEEIVAKKGSFFLSIHFRSDGTILDISYSLRDVPLTVPEIANIDKRIKKEIKATFTGREYVDYYVIYCLNIKIAFLNSVVYFDNSGKVEYV